ncbi:MAG: hypothetical protein MAG451_02610 [Anaerolineales bacterium]|nr:hypothetical protein [Anaerolineales bacterium]
MEGRNDIRIAPDALVAFGRPKGDRGSYLQWEEDGITPQVVFEILSPGNTAAEMERKFQFYQRYGVEEYYLYDPDSGELSGWLRRGAYLEEIEEMAGWVSVRLGIRFELEGDELVLYRPDGERFATFQELMAQREEARRQAEQERLRAEQAEQQTGEERQRAEQAEQQTEKERQRAEQAEQRAERFAAQLRELGVEPADE